MKYWITDKGNDKLIVITKEVLYNSNPSRKKIDNYQEELKKGVIPKQITGIPLNQIKSIYIHDSSDKIYIIKNNSDDDEIELDSRNNQKEIFDFLKGEIYTDKEVVAYSENMFNRVVKHIVPLGVLLFFTFLTYSYAIDLEMGYEYQLSSRRVRGAATGGLLLGIADTLGSLGVVILGTTLSMIPIYFIIQAIRTKKNIMKIRIK